MDRRHHRDPTATEVEVEQSVIALLLDNSETAWLVLDLVSMEDMLEPLHQQIWEAVRRVLDLGKEPGALTVAAAMASDQALSSMGGAEYLYGIIKRFGGNRGIARELCEALVDVAQKRALAIEIAETEARLSDPSVTARDVIAQHQSAVLALVEGRPMADDPVSWEDAGGEVIDRLGAQSIVRVRLQPYGIPEIDNEIGGMSAGDLVIVGARPGMGKTAVSLAIAHASAKPKEQISFDLDPRAPQQSVGVFLSSLEMGRHAILERGLSMAAFRRGIRIPYSQIRLGRLSEDQKNNLADAFMENRVLPLEIDDRRGLTLGQIGVRMRRAQARFARSGTRLGLGIIDHLGLIEPSGDYRGNKVAEVSATTRGLKILAGSLGIPLIVLCQLSRGVESREDKRPYLSDLRDSGSIEQDADVVIMLHRPEYYLRKSKPDDSAPAKERDAWQIAMDKALGRLNVAVAKNRNGPEADIIIKCDMAYNWIGTVG